MGNIHINIQHSPPFYADFVMFLANTDILCYNHLKGDDYNMLEYIKWLFNRDNVTLFIAIIGLVLSVWNFVKDLVYNHFKVKMFCKSLSAGKNGNEHIAYLQMFFENCSRVPVSISRIFLVVDKEKFEFEWRPHLVFEERHLRNKQVATEKYYYSEKLPRTIDGLGAWGGYFFLYFPQDFNFSKLLNTPKCIVIHTNRGIKHYSLNIPENALRISASK